MLKVSDIAASVDALMGVKAVWGRTDRLLCFGSRGADIANHRTYFREARATAEKSIDRPYVIAIGGGEKVSPSPRIEFGSSDGRSWRNEGLPRRGHL